MPLAAHKPPAGTLAPGEFVLALSRAGIERSEKWVRRHCRLGHIRTLPLPGRYLIPASELCRITKLEGLES